MRWTGGARWIWPTWPCTRPRPPGATAGWGSGPGRTRTRGAGTTTCAVPCRTCWRAASCGLPPACSRRGWPRPCSGGWTESRHQQRARRLDSVEAVAELLAEVLVELGEVEALVLGA